MSASQVLARKWRPKAFSELTGQEHVVRALANALDQGRLHHAYLLTGTRGVGKTTLARILAKALNCEKGVSSTPCGACAACTEIDGGRFVDLIELDAASNTQVDNMRELLESALYAPTSGRYKVYIIDEVHMLSRSAFNAMLKTLEEPPEHVKFVLATTDPQKIPVTVLSRCLQFNLKQIPAPLIAQRLALVLEQEGVAFEPAALTLIAAGAQGSLRDGLSLLDQAIAFGGGRVEQAAVRAMLGVMDQSYLLELARALVERDGPRLIAIADGMESRSLSFDGALQELATLFHRIALAQIVPEALGEEQPEREEILALARRFGPEEAQLCYQIALTGRNDLSYAPDEYAGFTMALMRMLAFRPGGGGPGTAQGREPAPAPKARQAPASAAPAAADPAPGPRAAEPAPAPDDPGARAAEGFDGDWLGLIGRLQVAGMSRMLAQYCELKRVAGDVMELAVPAMHRHLLEKSYQEKLAAAVRECLGHPYRLMFSVGETSGQSAAEVEERDRQTKQSRAVQSIESDPFVRDVVENFDARLIQSSIKPNQ
ncbi:MAG TPA: DNA polymerase III subunit gamma/tau [Burkholderiales bacterium]|nr:DNA polymerase III subunit gamma/tau [Burkholderiales bacterium]